MAAARLELVRRSIPEVAIVVLTAQPDLSGNLLTLQDYVVAGEHVIPVFTSEQAMSVSVGPGGLGRPTYSVRRDLLAQISTPDTVFLLDPQLPSQLRFTGEELREAFPSLPDQPPRPK